MSVLYAFVCRNHKKPKRWEALRDPKGNVSTSVCPRCKKPAPQDYEAKRVQGHVDGESSGYYPRELGFPRDPRNPMKSIAPARLKAKDAFKRARDETLGRVTSADD